MGRPRKNSVVTLPVDNNAGVVGVTGNLVPALNTPAFNPEWELRQIARDLAVGILKGGRGISDGVIDIAVKGALDIFEGVRKGVKERGLD